MNTKVKKTGRTNNLIGHKAKCVIEETLKVVGAYTETGFEYKSGWTDARVAEEVSNNTEWVVRANNVYGLRHKELYGKLVRHRPEEHMGVDRAEEAEAASIEKVAKRMPRPAPVQHDLYEDMLKLIDKVEALTKAFSRLHDRVVAIEYRASNGPKPDPKPETPAKPNGRTHPHLA